jgi:hypothetical protein
MRSLQFQRPSGWLALNRLPPAEERSVEAATDALIYVQLVFGAESGKARKIFCALRNSLLWDVT